MVWFFFYFFVILVLFFVLVKVFFVKLVMLSIIFLKLEVGEWGSGCSDGVFKSKVV